MNDVKTTETHFKVYNVSLLPKKELGKLFLLFAKLQIAFQGKQKKFRCIFEAFLILFNSTRIIKYKNANAYIFIIQEVANVQIRQACHRIKIQDSKQRRKLIGNKKEVYIVLSQYKMIITFQLSVYYVNINVACFLLTTQNMFDFRGYI